MSKKLIIDSIASEIAALKDLLIDAQQSGDIVGEIQLKYRISHLSEKMESMKEESSEDNSARVALFFGGQPVLGSKGIAVDFASIVLGQFQGLVAKIFASKDGELRKRRKVSSIGDSTLMVTGLVQGSFGFVLDEMSNQMSLGPSELSQSVDKAASLLKDIADQDDAVFNARVEELESGTLVALKDFFTSLDSSKATIRVVEKESEFTLNSADIYRAKTRTEATSIEETIEETTDDIEGKLIGFLPEHKKFELRNKDGVTIYGSVTKEAADQYVNMIDKFIWQKCLIKVEIKKTVSPLNREPKEVFRLIEFLDPQNNSE